MENTIQTKKIEGFKKKLFICMLACFSLSVFGVFAQSSGTIQELEDKAGLVMDLFSGRIIAVVFCFALIIIFAIIAWGSHQGESGSIIKRLTPWIIGAVGIGSAAGITAYFLGVSPN